ncbi:MAG: 3D domain-containing protein, partial [Flavobacteriaceae bacterium]|nr:3D domain-containing protein [Flavobacteriaceae bacterium]
MINSGLKYYLRPVRASVFLLLVLFWSCNKEPEDPYVWKELKVKVTAYNSTLRQTDGNPFLAAWGDTLKPGMKVVAVSPDLLRLGLKRHTPVKIKGLDSVYVVLDKTHGRKRN